MRGARPYLMSASAVPLVVGSRQAAVTGHRGSAGRRRPSSPQRLGWSDLRLSVGTAIVGPVANNLKNEMLLTTFETVVGEGVDLEAARKAFETTHGDFRAKLTAAMAAHLAPRVDSEVWIDIPEHPESLSKTELDALVRASPHVFVRSNATKADLLGHLEVIGRRQARRPTWIPRVRPDGSPVESAEAGPGTATELVDGVFEVNSLPEVGAVVVRTFAGDRELPRLLPTAGGIGEWESALFEFLGFTHGGPESSIVLDADANEALVPGGPPWWRDEPAKAKCGAEDPGVANELLATASSVGGIDVVEGSTEAYAAAVEALAGAGDWRFSPRWALDAYDDGESTVTQSAAHAAIAGWSDEERSGFVVYVFGGAFNDVYGLAGSPQPLHSHLLVVTRAGDGRDPVGAVHRVTLSCPGEYWCHRGGCSVGNLSEFRDIRGMLGAIATSVQAARRLIDSADATKSFELLYGGHDGGAVAESLLDVVNLLLSADGWQDVEGSEWEGGLEERLFRRNQHLLEVSYDPSTRQIALRDGKPAIEGTLDILGEDGVLIEEAGKINIDAEKATVVGWNPALVDAVSTYLRGKIEDLVLSAAAPQMSVLGLHPYSDGTLRAPDAGQLVEQQLTTFLAAENIIGSLVDHVE